MSYAVGHVLDKLVAEHVMLEDFCRTQGCECQGIHEISKGLVRKGVLWKPSVEMKFAQEVAKVMAEKFKLPLFLSSRDGKFEAKFGLRAEAMAGESGPHAICNAALAAVAKVVACSHESLRFGSGGRYVFCNNAACGASWIAWKMGADERIPGVEKGAAACGSITVGERGLVAAEKPKKAPKAKSAGQVAE
jgi:hypothetical protein